MSMMLDKIYKNLLKYTDDVDVDFSFWGNDTLDSFQYNFDYDSYNHFFESSQDSSDKALKVFIIAGPLNCKQQQKLLNDLESTSIEKRLVFKLRGSIIQSDLEKSYVFFDSSLIEEQIDFVLNKYPYDLNEVVDFLSGKVREKLQC
jgi:hypothetical protein